MGLAMGFSRSSRDKSHCMVGSSLRSASKSDTRIVTEAVEKSLPNPDPKNYRIVEHKQIGEFLVIKIKYLDCINYEGNKVLVFKTTLKKLKAQKYIDPHFCDNNDFISPIARFSPTRDGWGDALHYATVKQMQVNALKK